MSKAIGDASGLYRLVKPSELFDFVRRCMVSAGAKTDHAEALAILLQAADTRGHFSHGLNRLGRFYASCILLKFMIVLCPWKTHKCQMDFFLRHLINGREGFAL